MINDFYTMETTSKFRFAKIDDELRGKLAGQVPLKILEEC